MQLLGLKSILNKTEKNMESDESLKIAQSLCRISTYMAKIMHEKPKKKKTNVAPEL